VTIEPTSDILPHLPPPPYRRGRIKEGVVPFVSKYLGTGYKSVPAGNENPHFLKFKCNTYSTIVLFVLHFRNTCELGNVPALLG